MIRERTQQKDIVVLTNKHWRVKLNDGVLFIHRMSGKEVVYPERMQLSLAGLPDLVELLVEMQNEPERT